MHVRTADAALGDTPQLRGRETVLDIGPLDWMSLNVGDASFTAGMLRRERCCRLAVIDVTTLHS
jgi:hypothetical protein